MSDGKSSGPAEGKPSLRPGLGFLRQDPPETEAPPSTGVWRVLVVDDEPDIHSITKLALSDFTFEGKSLELITALSGEEGFARARENPDIAMAIIDVVMESEHAGLDLTRRIREELGNRMTRIVLRTGQPGSAPEAEVIGRYDIHDYKEKTELTTRKLFTLMFSSLRSYRDIQTIDRSKRKLEKLVAGSAGMFKPQSLTSLGDRALIQIDDLVTVTKGGILAQLAPEEIGDAENFRVISSVGALSAQPDTKLGDFLGRDRVDLLNKVLAAAATSKLVGDRYVGVFDARGRKVLFLDGVDVHNDVDRWVIDIFAQDLGVAVENIELRQTIEETQRELLYRLGGAVETKSKETISHVKRVAEIAYLFGLKSGLSLNDAEILRDAAPMHDVGKIGIPDAILNKPGKLDEEEWEVMKTHSQLGFNLLSGSGRDIIEAGALVALEHHEKWDGTGYPDGKKGEQISLFGRLIAIVDVFDALLSRRCYKEPWAIADVAAYIARQTGSQFDPKLTQTFLNHLDEIMEISQRYPD